MPAPNFEDLGAPSDFGSAAPPRSRSTALDDDDSTGTGNVSPEHVHFHTEEQRCDLCSYFSAGNCSYLKMRVPPEGGCIAFKAGGSDDDYADSDLDTTAAGDTDDDYGV
jgi:hypothetical protein